MIQIQIMMITKTTPHVIILTIRSSFSGFFLSSLSVDVEFTLSVQMIKTSLPVTLTSLLVLLKLVGFKFSRIIQHVLWIHCFYVILCLNAEHYAQL